MKNRVKSKLDWALEILVILQEPLKIVGLSPFHRELLPLSHREEKGTALIIKQNKPIVVPLVISGFSEAFSKDGLKLKKKGVKLHVEIKEPLPIDYDAPTDVIHEKIMDAIEQSEKFAQ